MPSTAENFPRKNDRTFHQRCLSRARDEPAETPLAPANIGSINALWPDDAIWSHAWILVNCGSCNGLLPDGAKPYLNQCWLITSDVQWQSSEGNFTRDTPTINQWSYLENYLSKISLKSPRHQWVNPCHCIVVRQRLTALLSLPRQAFLSERRVSFRPSVRQSMSSTSVQVSFVMLNLFWGNMNWRYFYIILQHSDCAVS